MMRMIQKFSVRLYTSNINFTYYGSCALELLACTVEINTLEVSENVVFYSFTGVGSDIESYICKLDGVTQTKCMLSWTNHCNFIVFICNIHVYNSVMLFKITRSDFRCPD